MPYKDINQQRAAQARYAAKRREADPDLMAGRKKASNRKAVARNKAIVNEFKSTGCTRCPEKRIPALDCHHRDDHEKLFEIAKRPTISEARLRAELAKCEVLCANCHRCEHNRHLEIHAVDGEAGIPSRL